MKIYALIVNNGEYGDPELVGAYSSPEKREEAIDLATDDFPDFHEIELDAMPETRPGLFSFNLKISEDGEISNIRHAVGTFAPVSYFNKWGNWKGADMKFWAKDEENAKQVAMCYREKLLAGCRWLKDHGWPYDHAAVKAQEIEEIEQVRVSLVPPTDKAP